MFTQSLERGVCIAKFLHISNNQTVFYRRKVFPWVSRFYFWILMFRGFGIMQMNGGYISLYGRRGGKLFRYQMVCYAGILNFRYISFDITMSSGRIFKLEIIFCCCDKRVEMCYVRTPEMVYVWSIAYIQNHLRHTHLQPNANILLNTSHFIFGIARWPLYDISC